jgi:hypothetical protein
MPRVATKLTQTANGGWRARKRIPADVQAAYQELYGVRWEASFHCDPMPVLQARARYREWQSEIEARFSNIRAERTGQGITLTPKTARALSGEWYGWFTQRHLDRPSPKEHWELFQELFVDQVSFGAQDHHGDQNDPHWDMEKVWNDNYEAREPARIMAADWAR